MKTKTYALACLVLISSFSGQKSFADDKTSGQNSYLSEVDQKLTVHKAAILPASDNVEGLYARFVEKKLISLLKETHRFDFVNADNVNSSVTLTEYESDPELVKKAGAKAGADILLVEKINKSKTGFDITLDLFLTNDGKLFAQETESNDPKFQISELDKKNSELYARIIKKIPYRGLILSRQGNRVTIDIGAKDGLKPDMIIDIEQIISVKRHPRFNFLLSTEKEVLGKIKIVKVDETLSFGIVLQEKQKGVVMRDSKITRFDFVTYSEAPSDATVTQDNLAPGSRKYLPKDAVSFGKNPHEWIPPQPPSLGKLGISLGLGTLHNALVTQTGNYSSEVPIYPQLDLTTEIWITQNWYGGLNLSQGVFSVANPSGGNPSTLNANNTSYQVEGGYKFLLQDEYFGPQVNLHAGYSNYSMYVDASSPITFTSMTFGGIYLGFGGSFPLFYDRSVYLDANLDRVVFSNLTETPNASGDASSSSVTRFSLGGSYRLNTQFFLTAHFNFDFYSATFSGAGSRPDPGVSANQNLITLLSGINFLF